MEKFEKLLNDRNSEIAAEEEALRLKKKNENAKTLKIILLTIGAIIALYLISIIVHWVRTHSGWEIAGYLFLFFMVVGLLGRIFDW